MNFTKNPANFNDTEKLLYLIWQELQKINTVKQPKPEPVRPTREATEDKAKVIIKCKKCGEEFNNRGSFFQHMKQHKKEGT